MLAREVELYGRTKQPGPVALGELLKSVERFELAEVDRMRAAGQTWASLAVAYGVGSGQAVQQRIGRLRARVASRS